MYYWTRDWEKDRRIEQLQFRIPESPRFFEAMLVGRKWDEPSHITSRICGICSVAHTYASIKATETAFGVVPTDKITKLRKLIFHHECVQSNALGSSMGPLQPSHPEPLPGHLASHPALVTGPIQVRPRS